ncbi:class I SAM-dependent methyltransferase [Streptomyces longispororuber]|uniref:class I SAM-dependent methyltransferase n=1 Tax=Streptomyces longispororuber TaxID=68230 RepID=UPI0037025C41
MRAETAYHGDMGEHFAAQATDSAYNAHTDRAAMLRLAGDVRGRRVLDLGCGAGHYAAELLARGAERVTGVEGSETLLAAARTRLAGSGDGTALHHHDLEEPLSFLDDHAFDLAVLALVYHHVEARGQLLAEVRRVLRPGGTLLVSTTHPTSDWTYFGGSYFSGDRVELPFGSGVLRYRRMTLETFLGELLGAGFVLEELVEPRATEEARRVDPRRYDKTHTQPLFLAVRLHRP